MGETDNIGVQFVITNLAQNTAGLTYRVMVRANNREATVDSPYLMIVNAGRPLDIDTPVLLLSRNETSLSLKMPVVSDDDSVLSYELQIDDGFGN